MKKKTKIFAAKRHSELLACADCGRLLILVVDKFGPSIGCYACDLWEDLWLDHKSEMP